jgi:hypothetical protein
LIHQKNSADNERFCLPEKTSPAIRREKSSTGELFCNLMTGRVERRKTMGMSLIAEGKKWKFFAKVLFLGLRLLDLYLFRT